MGGKSSAGRVREEERTLNLSDTRPAQGADKKSGMKGSIFDAKPAFFVTIGCRAFRGGARRHL